jgi:uncharacterized lipoprotein YddW (UPF0748 family)
MRFFRGSFLKGCGASVGLLVAAMLVGKCEPAFSAGSITPGKAPETEEVRGIWMWSNSVREEGAEKIAKQLAEHRINKVFLLVKGYSGDVCYPSRIAPASNGGADTLGELLAACHKRNIQVHAWFVFNADTVWGKKHPEDAMYHAGDPAHWSQGPYSKKDDPKKIPICPLSKGYRAYFKSLVQEVLDRYDIDGIHLDYIRYGHMCYCFCPRHQAAAATNHVNLATVRQAIYDSLYGPKKKSDYYFDQFRAGNPDIKGWVTMREAEIDQAVKETREMVKKKKPSLALSAAFMPEGGENDDTYALCHYGQNYSTAGAELDYILPMTYAKGSKWVAQIALNAEKKSHRPVYSGVWACDQAPGAAADDEAKTPAQADSKLARKLREDVQTVRKQGIKGFVLFRYGSMTDQMWEQLP